MRPDRWTLRTRLVVSILALTTIALVLANVIGVALLQGMLMRRVDEQLSAGSTAIQTRIAQPPPGDPQLFTAPTGLDKVLVKRMAEVSRIMVFSPSGRLRAMIPPTQGPSPDITALRYDGPYTVPGTEGAGWRVHAAPLPGGETVVVGTSLDEVEQTSTALIAIAATVSIAVLVLLGMAADWLVRLGLRPLTRMERTAAHIADGDFARRVPDPDPHTESGRLGLAMNVMLDRVTHEIAARTASETRMRRFLADASHELRTPLTSVRGFAELHRRGGGDTDETMRRIEDAATRMGVLVNDLLTLAQLDEERQLDRGKVDLLEVAADTIRDARARVPGRQVRLAGLDETLAPVSLVGDEARLRQVAANLVANALAHTPAEAAVTVRVGRAAGQAVLEVADTGPGIDARHVPYLFDRLYRVGQGRSRADGGAGLGLAIVAAIVHAHDGKVTLDTAPGEGSRFRVFLPASEAAPSRL
ncbi:sensor histidine kinase [Nonomuraea typhae]|uniref:sensor histidine kinase n=1 Tax=Nonomuraea typhae TaxID=2603600 RepID=UPI001C66682C|nr:ATP-binding protein [Nonomuraea typhae]